MINNVPVIDLHLFRLGSTLTPLKKVLSFINSTASQFIEQMVNPNRFYTYAYLREDRTPYYIGKGSRKRAYTRSKRDIKPPKDKSRIILLKQNLTEEEAFKHEKYMIAVFGRIDLGTGILLNRTNGGDGGPSGRITTQETRNKFIGNNHAKGNKIDREIVDRLTDHKRKNKWWNNGIEQKFCHECPCGWVSGRLPLTKGNYSKPGDKNPRAKIWEITYDDGTVEIVKCLKEWCKKTDYNFYAIRYAFEKKKPYKNILTILELGRVYQK
jgi:hypothetical protein